MQHRRVLYRHLQLLTLDPGAGLELRGAATLHGVEQPVQRLAVLTVALVLPCLIDVPLLGAAVELVFALPPLGGVEYSHLTVA